MNCLSTHDLAEEIFHVFIEFYIHSTCCTKHPFSMSIQVLHPLDAAKDNLVWDILTFLLNTFKWIVL